MEKVELRVERLAGADVGRHWFAVFGVAGGTIGRGGQNKLVLPDTDSGVARVHAMVRLESDAAYIANLCERRSLYVAGLELLSGQEVQLHLGVDVQIGPYSLRAVQPGTPANKVVASTEQSGALVAAPAVVAPAPAQPSMSALTATPNPWADIPAQTWGEDHAASDVPLAVGVEAPSVLLGSSGTSLPTQVVDNPFAMLGRVESSSTSPDAAETKAATERLPNANPWGLESNVLSAASIAQAAATQPSAMDVWEIGTLVKQETLSATVPKAGLLNIFDGLGVPTRAVAPALNRPLVIPADFDPFAPDLKKESENRDPWAGGLPARSLSDVANIKSDELIRSLPLKGHFEEALDNPAHSGLPKALDPKAETDPMRLFESAGVMQGLVSTTAEATRGPELVQMFNLPRGGEPDVPSNGGLQAFTELGQPDSAAELSTPAAPSAKATASGGLPPVPTAFVRAETSPAEPAAPLVEPPSVTEVEVPAQPAIPVESLANASNNTLDAQALIDAFLDGAGLAPGRVDAVMTPEFMRHFGEAFRVAVQGTIDLLAARSEIKREFRADVTIIAQRANNPLKFLPNADGVIMQMVGQSFPGFMKPVPSMKEAYFDLQVHQLALMAGIRAAYAEALARFDPVELEKRCDANGGLIRKISTTLRKALVWDDYKHSYNAIRRHAEDDLVAFSGEAFVKAYDATAEATRATR